LELILEHTVQKVCFTVLMVHSYRTHL